MSDETTNDAPVAWAYDVMTGDDWGDGPAHESDYDYRTRDRALAAALYHATRYPFDQTGVYLYGARPGMDSEEWIAAPLVLAPDGERGAYVYEDSTRPDESLPAWARRACAAWEAGENPYGHDDGAET